MIGATEIALAIKLRREIKGEWFLILMGLLSIVFAIMLLWNPLPGAARSCVAHWVLCDRVWNPGIILGFRLRSLPTLPVR